jgi:hypothetical protein
MSVIAVVGVRTVYISSRRKKCSMRLKMSIIFSWLPLAFLAAWEPWCQNSLRKRDMKNTNQEENADPRKDCICRLECLIVNVKAEILHDKISQYTLAQHPGQQLRKMHTVHSRLGRPILSVCRRHSGIGWMPVFALEPQ